MQAYCEILPPTAVTHAARASLTGPKAHNLAVAKTSVLQIFDLKTIEVDVDHITNGVPAISSLVSPVEASNHNQNDIKQPQTKFILVAEYALSGTVTSLAAVKLLNTKAGGQALLVSFKDAKVSLVEWDPEIHGLSTISIHYYEGEALAGSPWSPSLAHCPSFLTVDPSSRCAALRFGQRHLAILPFRQAGDDIAMENYDPDIDGPSPQAQSQVNGVHAHAGESKPTPYAASFVLPLTEFDPSLIHAIDLAFLHEYREPTLGVLSSSKSPSHVLHPERKDCLSYTVFTLDLEQRASTPLLSVSGLPYDIIKIVPLPLPIGGTLLLGGNEIIHVDQSGKTNAIAVNEFAKQCSSFPMIDHSDLALKLENCVVEQINRSTGDMLVVLDSGDLNILSFRVDGRSVSGLSMQGVSPARGGNVLGASASCAVTIGHDTIFVGSEEANSVILRCRRSRAVLARKRSHAEMLGLDEITSEEDMSDEDDLYANDTSPAHQLIPSISQTDSPDEVSFVVQDALVNLSPIAEPTFGQRRDIRPQTFKGSADQIDLVLPVGHGRAGSLVFLNRKLELQPTRHFDIDEAVQNVWALNVTKGDDEEEQKRNGHRTGMFNPKYDRYLIMTSMCEGADKSSVYGIVDGNLELLNDTNIENDIATLNAGVLGNGARVIQITSGEVRCYDQELGLAQIVPMLDESSDAELKIIHTSFADPYLLILRDDASITILKAEENGDVEEVNGSDVLSASKWTCGCLHRLSGAVSTTYAYLSSTNGSLQVFELPRLDKPVYSIESFRGFPYLMSAESGHRRSPAREEIREILVCDIGDDIAQKTYMIIRTAADNIVLYEAYHCPRFDGRLPFVKNLRWIKRSLDHIPQKSDEDNSTKQHVMRAINLGQYRAALLPLSSPCVLLREASSRARLMQMGIDAGCAISGIAHKTCNSGVVAVTEKGAIDILGMPAGITYTQTGWAVRQVPFEEEIDAVVYHPDSGLYMVATSIDTNFVLPEDDWHHEWALEDTSFSPSGKQGKLALFDPKSQTIIHELQLEPDERVMCSQLLNLEVSEKTHERQTLMAVGTAIVRGEDLPAVGSIYILDVIAVVPELDRPETDKALKLVVKEDSKGAVTAISEIGSEGFLLAAQGQKCMVRGLKEDNTLLPIAFMDMQCYVSCLKNVKGTGLVLMADAMEGVWFTGFMSDPYALKLFGKSTSDVEVVAAEVLPHNKQLFLLAADADCLLHVFEFNPENPKSLSGQQLITRSTFNAGDFVQSMTLLPSIAAGREDLQVNGDTVMHDDESGEQESLSQVLLTMQSGSMALVTSLDEPTYRRLDALQTHMISILDHPCGLNPRAYRKVESEGFGARGMIDGQLLKRWSTLGSQRKAEACTKVGAEAWEIAADIDLINGGQLHYL